MPSPRQIAEKVNNSSNFDKSIDSSYNGTDGLPAGVQPQGKQPDYAANPTNPAEPSAPAKNLSK